MNQEDSQNIREAKRALTGMEKTLKEKWKLVKGLKRDRDFSFARRILERMLENRTMSEAEFENAAYPNDLLTRNLLIQQHALCTYKDQDSPAVKRLDDAVKILDEIKDFGDSPEEKVETLASTGQSISASGRWKASASTSNAHCSTTGSGAIRASK